MAEYRVPENYPPMSQHLPMKCELCGKESQICCMLFLGDWRGLACPECIDQVSDSMHRKFIPACEQTEPSK